MSDLVFLHSGFRTGSSWLRSKFRSCSDALVFGEIFHEALATIDSQAATSLSPDSWETESRHPAAAPYFIEFAPLISPSGGIDLFSEEMAYDLYFPRSDGLSKQEEKYIQLLLDHSSRMNKEPVLSCTRSIGRLKQIKNAFGGMHILLTRDPFAQWCSYTEQATAGNPYFFRTNELILKSAKASGWLTFGDGGTGVRDALNLDAFYKHVLLHLKLYNEAAGEADIIVNYDRLVSEDYRDEITEQIVSKCGIALDLSDFRRSNQFSLVNLPSPEVLDQVLLPFLPSGSGAMHPHVKILYGTMKASIRSYEDEAGKLVRFSRRKLSELHTVSTQLEQRRSELEVVSSELNSARAELDAKTAEFEDARTRLESALAELENARGEAEGELDRLRSDLSQAQQALAAARENQSNAETVAKVELARLEERTAYLTEKLHRSQEELDRSRSEADEARTEAGQAHADAEQAHIEAEHRHAALEHARAEAEAARVAANEQIARYQDEFAKAAALIRSAVSKRPGRWQRIGEALGLARRSTSLNGIAAWAEAISARASSLPSEIRQPPDVQTIGEQAEVEDLTHAAETRQNDMIETTDAKWAPMTLDDLLDLHDEDFVQSAYRLLLDRDADLAGLSHYTRQLRSGASRIGVLADFARSPEGREVRAEVPGLRRAIRRQRLYRLLRLRPLRIALFGRYRDSMTRLRAIENRLAVLTRKADDAVTELSTVPEAPTPDAAVSSLEPAISMLEVPPASTQVGLTRKPKRELAGLHMLPAIGTTDSSDAAATKCIAYSVGHTCNCPVNTGVQRVARQLARALIGNGERLVFVKWNDDEREFELLTREEIEHFGKWSGPDPDEIFGIDNYPAEGTDGVFLKDAAWLEPEWMFFPEVHHLGIVDHEITINQINAGRALNLKTAAVFYDAIPLRRAELAPMAALHEAYMRQLMDADIIFPISNFSGGDLEVFFRSYEGLDPERMPLIKPVLLPAEMPEKPRVKSAEGHEKMVLCVGSIDERKNQLLLAEAFAKLVREEQVDGWRLVLVGNCNPGLHTQLSEFIENYPAIEWLGPISDEELAELYAKAAFCVFPSIEEGYGLPIAESLWMGRPCICANFGPMAEVAAAGGCLTLDTSNAKALKEGLRQLIVDRRLRKKLQKHAAAAELGTWADYASVLQNEMQNVARGTAMLGPIYYVAEHTTAYPNNTGIQRVTRMLARSLLEIGAPLIAAKWNRSRSGLEPPTAAELKHLARFNGPKVEAWAPWVEPGSSAKVGWVLLPELTPHFGPTDYHSIRSFLDSNMLRAACIFYDTIPWKMKDLYPEGAAIAHATYMRGINKYERIFPISRYSGDELRKFYLTEREPTVDLAHRIATCVLPGEFPGRDRAVSSQQPDDGILTILSVGSLEARKNHVTLVEAFLKAKPMIKGDARLVLAGGAPDPAVLAELKELMAASDSIEWIDRPTDKTLDRLYRECHFTVYPSVEEGFGLPILESNWYGKPSISSCFGAMREAAEGGGCLLVDTTDVDAMASAIVRLANSDHLRLALAQEACERQTKTWAAYATEILDKLITDTPLPAGSTQRPSAKNEWNEAFPNLSPRPLLSICITTYNRAAWLKRSLQALLKACAGLEDQVEVVVCDNASTDDTADVMRTFADENLVRYYRNARNVGMLGNLLVTSQKARGEYMWIVGDDDLVVPQGVANVLKALKENPGASLLYTNYAYTREEDPEKADNLGEFYATATRIADGGESFVGLTKEVAVQNENFFTAIYCIVFRRDHGLRAYGQYTGGEPFSSLPTCVPTTNYVLKNVMDDKAVWLAEPQIVVNLNVSWLKYAWRWILERFPEIHDTAVRHGANPEQVDRWRTHHLPSMVHFLGDAYGASEGGRSEFDLRNLILDVKHLDRYPEFRDDFKRIYSAAVLSGHPAAKYDPDELFVVSSGDWRNAALEP